MQSVVLDDQLVESCSSQHHYHFDLSKEQGIMPHWQNLSPSQCVITKDSEFNQMGIQVSVWEHTWMVTIHTMSEFNQWSLLQRYIWHYTRRHLHNLPYRQNVISDWVNSITSRIQIQEQNPICMDTMYQRSRLIHMYVLHRTICDTIISVYGCSNDGLRFQSQLSGFKSGYGTSPEIPLSIMSITGLNSISIARHMGLLQGAYVLQRLWYIARLN